MASQLLPKIGQY